MRGDRRLLAAAPFCRATRPSRGGGVTCTVPGVTPAVVRRGADGHQRSSWCRSQVVTGRRGGSSGRVMWAGRPFRPTRPSSRSGPPPLRSSGWLRGREESGGGAERSLDSGAGLQSGVLFWSPESGSRTDLGDEIWSKFLFNCSRLLELYVSESSLLENPDLCRHCVMC